MAESLLSERFLESSSDSAIAAAEALQSAVEGVREKCEDASVRRPSGRDERRLQSIARYASS